MRKSTSIQNDIDAATARRDALQAEAETAQADVTFVRDELLAGRADAKTLAAARAQHEAISSAANTLNERLAALHGELDAALAVEHKADVLARITEIAARANEQLREYDAGRRELDDYVRDAIAEQIERLDALADSRRQFLALSEQIDSLSGLDADLTAVRRHWHGTPDTGHESSYNFAEIDHRLEQMLGEALITRVKATQVGPIPQPQFRRFPSEQAQQTFTIINEGKAEAAHSAG